MALDEQKSNQSDKLDTEIMLKKIHRICVEKNENVPGSKCQQSVNKQLKTGQFQDDAVRSIARLMLMMMMMMMMMTR
jgi:hypothetical protein